MSDTDDADKTRRDVLKAAAVVGATARAVSMPAAASTGWTAVGDRSIDYSLAPSEPITASGMVRADGPTRAVETGQRLVESLAADGLLESATLDALPTGEFTAGGADGVYHVTNLGFRLQTSEGQLTLVFSTDSAPLARFTPAEGGQVLYGTKDFETFTRELQTFNGGSIRPQAGSCRGCSCSGYPCCSTCYPETRLVCEDEYNGDCIISTNCAC